MCCKQTAHQSEADGGGADVAPHRAADAAEDDVWQVVRADGKALQEINTTVAKTGRSFQLGLRQAGVSDRQGV
jgi:hypothetical protein